MIVKKIFEKIIAGFASYGAIKALFYNSYPFPFPEKAITYDWDNIGKDINLAIEKLENERE